MNPTRPLKLKKESVGRSGLISRYLKLVHSCFFHLFFTPHPQNYENWWQMLQVYLKQPGAARKIILSWLDFAHTVKTAKKVPPRQLRDQFRLILYSFYCSPTCVKWLWGVSCKPGKHLVCCMAWVKPYCGGCDAKQKPGRGSDAQSFTSRRDPVDLSRLGQQISQASK